MEEDKKKSASVLYTLGLYIDLRKLSERGAKHNDRYTML